MDVQTRHLLTLRSERRASTQMWVVVGRSTRGLLGMPVILKVNQYSIRPVQVSYTGTHVIR